MRFFNWLLGGCKEQKGQITTNTNIFVDARDNHKYKTVRIGDQTWMAENLACRVDDGCVAYGDNKNNVKKYGYLYNWETACKIAPEGWHLPSLEEFEILKSNADGKLENLIIGGDTGFSALYGGSFDSRFKCMGEAAYFWTSTPYGTEEVGEGYCCLMSDFFKITFIDAYRSLLMSVRCIRDI